MFKNQKLIYLQVYCILLVVAFAASSCSSAEHAMMAQEEEGQHHLNEQHHSERASTDLSALEELYWTRLEASRSSFTEADVDFMTDMIAHHAQALIMSRLAPENGASRAVQTLAARIHNAQEDEIATMQKWLRDRNQSVPEVYIDGLILMIHMKEPDKMENTHGRDEDHHTEMDGHMVHEEGHGHHQQESHNDHDHEKDDSQMMMAHHHHHDMPGMLTQDQLEELADARGIEFDYKFLAFMIEHHLGAVYMVDQLFSSDGAANDNEIFDLASDIHAEQVTEINRMRLMLEEIESAL